MRFLKQNTATRVTVGPFQDKTDGVTPETSLTVTSCKLTLCVDDAGVPTLVLDAAATASAGNNDMVHITGDDAGFYDLELTAAQTNYVGRAMLSITDAATHCPVFHEFMILPANVFDAWMGTDKLDVNAAELGGTTQTGRDIGTNVLLSSGTGTGQLSLSSGTVTVGTNNDKTGYTASTVSDKTGYALSAGGVQAIWDALSAALTTANSIGKRLVDNLTGDIYARIGAPAGASVSADIAAVKAETATILSDTNDIQTRLPAALVSGRMDSSVGAMAANTLTASALATDAGAEIADAVWDEAISGHLTGGSTGASLNGAGSAGDPWTTALPGAYSSGTAGKILGDNLNATVSSRATQTSLDTVDDFLDTEVAAIKAKTDNLPSDPADASDIAASFSTVNSTLSTIAGYVDTEVAAIKAKTDLIPASPAAVGDIPSAATVAAAVLAQSLAAESYAADGGTPTISQVLWMIMQGVLDYSIAGTTLTVKKQDGTAAMTFTLDSATEPTSRTRAT